MASNKGGRPPFKPTEKQITIVQTMAACGAPFASIAAKIINPQTKKPITEKTMSKWFHAELAAAKADTNARVAKSLFQKATGTGPAAVTAAIFWLKTQARWKEPAAGLEVSAPGGGPVGFYDAAAMAKLSTEQLAALEAALTVLAGGGSLQRAAPADGDAEAV